MQAEPLITWPEPIWEYVKFVSEFVAVGAVGFCYAAVRGRDRGESAEAPFYSRALARAAIIGLVAQVVQAFLFWHDLPGQIERAHAASAMDLLTHHLATGSQAGLIVVGLLGFAVAAGRMPVGWPLAATGVVLGQLTAIVDGKWSRLVNPVHRLVGSLWLGTLFVLVVAGLTPLLRDESVRDRRGSIAADMVNSFSPVALTCGMIVILSGLVAAWTHLNPLSSLWTTPYGYALLVKLALVAVVFALGAWNWRRVRPSLGSDEGAVTIRRSSVREVTMAAIVLMASAILVSLPSPRPPGARGPGGPPGGEGGPPPAAAPQ
jgi:putative copper export protein